MIEFSNKVFIGANGRKSLFDAQIAKNNKAVVIFAHGYKGYKDWGCWDLMGKAFIKANYGFVKFNFSHNGGTVENPIDFHDLKAFGENRYTYELEDLKIITNELERMLKDELEHDIPIYLIGHSRAGGMAIIYSSGDNRIKKMVSLAGISDIGSRFPEADELKEWEREGVRFVQNGRTNQEMPHYYSFYADFEKNKELLFIERAAESLTIPFLQVHGDMDMVVPISEGLALAKWTSTRVEIIKGAEHTFEAKQPWAEEKMPYDMVTATSKMIHFFDS